MNNAIENECELENYRPQNGYKTAITIARIIMGLLIVMAWAQFILRTLFYLVGRHYLSPVDGYALMAVLLLTHIFGAFWFSAYWLKSEHATRMWLFAAGTMALLVCAFLLPALADTISRIL